MANRRLQHKDLFEYIRDQSSEFKSITHRQPSFVSFDYRILGIAPARQTHSGRRVKGPRPGLFLIVEVMHFVFGFCIGLIRFLPHCSVRSTSMEVFTQGFICALSTAGMCILLILLTPPQRKMYRFCNSCSQWLHWE